MLVVLPDEAAEVRFGITAGRSVGGAVQRNRAKRLLRSGVQPLIQQVNPGWKAILIARRPILEAPFCEIQSAIRMLLQRARLLRD